jgi:histidinol-phosphate aminotransferase
MTSRTGNDPDVLPLAPPPPTPVVAALRRTPEATPEDGLVRLNRNERLEPLPAWFVDRIRGALDGDLLTGYPSTDSLYERLSEWLGVARERLLLTAGSDSAVRAVYQALLRPGDGVVSLEPSYAMYQVYAQMFQAQAVEITIPRSLEVDRPQLLEAIRPGVRLVMLANPNQPTGTLLEEEFLLRVLERAARIQALVAVDEAYFPFSRHTMLPYIEEFPNLLVIRTLSKAAGLAGLRVGFAAGHPEVVQNLWKLRPAEDINAMAILCAREMLAVPELIEDCVANVDAGKETLAVVASELGLEPLPTATNFMLLRVPSPMTPGALVAALHDEGFLVRGPFGAPCIADCIRVTLGPPALMSQFGEALRRATATRAADLP